MIRIEKKPMFKDAKDLQSLANMLAPQYRQPQNREFYLNDLLPDFIGTDMDYWMLIRRYYALKEQCSSKISNYYSHITRGHIYGCDLFFCLFDYN